MVEYPTERTLYPVLLEIFKELGFTGIQEIRLPGRRYPDAKISYKDNAFYVQVKIGKLDILKDILNDISKLIAHREKYVQISDVIGFIGIKFEEDIRKVPLITGKEEQILKEAIKNKKVFIIISAFKEGRPLFYIIDGGITFAEAKQQIIEKLREFIEERKTLVNPESVVRLLKEYINELAFILRTYYLSQSSEALVNLIGDISLFKSLLGVKEGEDINELLKNEDYRAAIVDLLAFILVNQILFYYLYSKRSKGKLPELKQISSLLELREYFNKILEIDFKVIYSINIFEKLPNDKQILDTINNIINVLNASPVWKIPHDLLGRVYHELLPFRTRKVFATFYTHPIAAEILAGLTIDDYKETVIDPACGSGTLLVAAYNAKKELYLEYLEQKSFISVEDEIRLHKQFVERDITGIDIMPFAAHIAAMNLSLQNIDAETNNLRIGVEDSLYILDKLASVNNKNWTLTLETVSTELVKIIKSLKSKQKSLLKYLNNNKENKANIIIYTIDTLDAEDQILTKLKEKGYKIFNVDDKNIDFNSSYLAIVGINNHNINKLQNILRKLQTKNKFNLVIVVRKGRLSEEIIEELKEMFKDIPIETRDIFTIKPFDVVIMNPPFTDRDKMPKEYQQKLNELVKKLNFINKNIGGQVNLWGYFLGLTHLLLKGNGKIGAVIPINIARGKATEKLRKFFLENYLIRWIVKPVADLAFSEAAAFRDILFVVEKRKPKENDITGIVFIKKSIRDPEFTIEETKRIVDELKILYKKAKDGKIKHYEDPGGFYEIYFVDYKTLEKYEDNLMPLLKETGLEGELMEIILERAKNKLCKIKNLLVSKGKNKQIFEGFGPRPEGCSELVFIVNPIHGKNRIERNVHMIIKRLLYPNLEFEHVPTHNIYKILIDYTRPALKTLTSVRRLYLYEEDLDRIFIKLYPQFNIFSQLVSFKSNKLQKINQIMLKLQNKEILREYNKKSTFVSLQHRINLVSPNTYIISACSDVKYLPTNAFHVFLVDRCMARMLCLFFNSIIGIYQFLKVCKRAQGTWLEIKQKDIIEFYVICIKDSRDRNIEKQLLLELFEEIKDIEFPSIMEQMKKGWEHMKQYKDKSWDDIFKELKQNDLGMYVRIKLDYTILKVLGFDDNEIKELLEKAYEVVYKELEAIKKVK